MLGFEIDIPVIVVVSLLSHVVMTFSVVNGYSLDFVITVVIVMRE